MAIAQDNQMRSPSCRFTPSNSLNLVLVAALAAAFLELCFYVVHRTGSIEGLAASATAACW